MLHEIFNIMRGKRLKKENQKLGNTPYISSSGINNGVDGFISNDKNVRFFEKCLTIANSGSVGTAFFHNYKFIASDHVTSLKNVFFNKYSFLYTLPLLNKLSEKYGFNREINDKRIKREKILLPVNIDKKPNYDFMQKFMLQIEYKQIKKILKYYSKRCIQNNV